MPNYNSNKLYDLTPFKVCSANLQQFNKNYYKDEPKENTNINTLDNHNTHHTKSIYEHNDSNKLRYNNSDNKGTTKSLSKSSLTKKSYLTPYLEKMKKTIIRGAKDHKFQQNEATHNELDNAHKNTKDIPIKKNPRRFNNGNGNWSKFTDDDLLKYFRDHH